MKYFSSLLIIAILALGNTSLYAQKIGTTTKPQVRTVSTNFLPAKQALLLFEITDMTAADEIDDPDNPEAEFQEEKLAEQIFDLNILLHLFSTANIAKIHAKIGTRAGAGDHATYSFKFDQKKGLPEPFTFSRDGKTVVLGMGKVKGMQPFHLEVVMESHNGQLSEPRYFKPE